jgi:hypothetical protein
MEYADLISAMKLHVESNGACYNRCEYFDKPPSCSVALVNDVLKAFCGLVEENKRLSNEISAEKEKAKNEANKFADKIAKNLAAEFDVGGVYKGITVRYIVEKKIKEAKQ